MAAFDIGEQAKSLREEVQHLFGLRWDSFIEWTLIGWLSLWLWTSWLVSNSLTLPTVGPIEWIADVLRALDVEPAAWLLGIPAWLTAPDRAWLLQIFVIAAAAAATLAARSYRHSGLRVLSLACAVLAYEVDASASPVLQIMLFSAIPLVVALLVSFLPDQREWDDHTSPFYHREGMFWKYVTRVLALFFAPAFAPVLLFAALVTSYRTEPLYEPASDLAFTAASELDAHGAEQKLADADALAVVSALVAAITAGSTHRESRRAASTFNYRWKQRREARAARERDERRRRFGLGGEALS
ncbi:hypothetical protein [Agromyces italicus]|uniref:hypothetical protein n=1 Tax=Agromyces italicus TaxID=279572 RepID=UPI0003B48F63|nr:hypothetical protein [Agromyces italicus]